MVLDYTLEAYRFTLPEEQIAQTPSAQRGDSRLMVLDPSTGACTSTYFRCLLDFLPDNALLVANNSRVIPARLCGRRHSGGKVEWLLLTPAPLIHPMEAQDRAVSLGLSGTDWQMAQVDGLIRPAKKIALGELVQLSASLYIQVLEKGDFGQCVCLVLWQGSLLDQLAASGELPLPPYIRRSSPHTSSLSAETTGAQQQSGASFTTEASQQLDNTLSIPVTDSQAQALHDLDALRYQTVYARQDKSGSMAAPTAGLHFTPELRQALLASGRTWAEATLYVGYGTFSPVRSLDIREHSMHAEYMELSAETAQAVVQAKQDGRPVIAVGTTSARLLEGAWLAQHGDALQGNEQNGSFALQAYTGWINAFFYPGKQFQVIDGLITNFHLPESSLLMLVSALAGRERILAAYTKAIAEGFRFFSYGDAMYIRPPSARF